jgi:hypothetical protein
MSTDIVLRDNSVVNEIWSAPERKSMDFEQSTKKLSITG